MAAYPSQIRSRVVGAAFARPKLRELIFRCVDLRDGWHIQAAVSQSVPLPPTSLRFRVHGDVYPTSFLETGRQCSEDLKNALANVGVRLDSFKDVLDFGCGCGRTLLWLGELSESTRLYGTDIDANAIRWCRRHIGFARFTVNSASPPLAFVDESFDLVYAVSVFTHLDEPRQFDWLSELRRVARHGGYVLVTLRGTFQHARMLSVELEHLREVGFTFEQMPNNAMAGIFPTWYQTATHTREYVETVYSRYFEVVEFLPNGLDQCQDIVVLRRQ
jgi:ubiquinone/menaquinone biosynthesis C-methylase UbiE